MCYRCIIVLSTLKDTTFITTKFGGPMETTLVEFGSSSFVVSVMVSVIVSSLWFGF